LLHSGRGLGHVNFYVKYWDSPNIFGTAEDTNLQFCMQIDLEGQYTKNYMSTGGVAYVT